LKTLKAEADFAKVYWNTLKRLAKSPGLFFKEELGDPGEAETRRFMRLNGLLLAALFFFIEAISGGRINWALLLAAVLSLTVLPFLMEALAFSWAFFTSLAARVLGESIDTQTTRRVMAFSTAGLLPLAFGGGWLSLLALWAVGLQIIGLEKALPCSRFKATILAGFPFLLFLTLAFMVTIIFKTRVF
jgi:hypothetical protein